ncbi:hypothetical protein [Acinetobacter sp. MB5]|uniref:hypothetical protein n=1 Tax=Acinetobacter sp. MB5 TaxID=2069438 RepID=UPI001D0D95C7|nr:hypothetical protein [Acinetobacter sp. MB5]
MRWVTLLLICFGFWGSSEVMAQQPVERHLQIQGIEREYLVLDAHHQQQPAPLVLVLHGGGGNASRMLKRWQSVAEREGLIVIAPNAQAATWNAGGCCGQAQQQQSADAAFFSRFYRLHNCNIQLIHIVFIWSVSQTGEC